MGRASTFPASRGFNETAFLELHHLSKDLSTNDVRLNGKLGEHDLRAPWVAASASVPDVVVFTIKLLLYRE